MATGAYLMGWDGSTSGWLKVDSATRGSQQALSVQIVDASGNQITSFGGAGGGGTQYIEDDASAGGETGTVLLAVRNDAAAAKTSANGDFSAIAVDSAGRVGIADLGGSITVDGTVTANLAAGTNNIGDVDVLTVPAPLSTTGGGTEAAALRVTIANNSTGVVSVDDNGTTISIDDGGGIITVDGTVSITANSAVNVAQFGGTNVVNGGTAGTQSVGGIQAHDAAIANNNPVLIGGLASATAPAAVNANGDLCRLWTTTTGALNIADAGSSITVDNAGTFVVQIDGAALTALQLIDDTIITDDAAFTVGTTKVSMKGGYAVAHGSNPDAADAGDAGAMLMNRHRIPFVMGGHPNIITRTTYIADADGAQTNASIVGTIAAGTRMVVTAAAVTVDYQTNGPNGSGVAVKLGFGTASVPADSATGANGILLDHKGVPGGGGVVLGNGAGIVGIGGNDEELRLTCEDPINGGLSVTVTYYTIES